MLNWMNDPLLKDMDPIKKELFMNAASQVAGKSGNAMASVMMQLIMNARKKKIQFSPEEMNLILQVLKQGKSPEEQKNIDKTVQLVMNMMRKNNKK